MALRRTRAAAVWCRGPWGLGGWGCSLRALAFALGVVAAGPSASARALEDGVEAQGLGLLGWSNGGSAAVLAAEAPRGPAAEVLPVTVRAWAGACHGFDGQAPLRLRRDVPNGATPGQGVHVGAHPLARAQSQALVRWHLQQALGVAVPAPERGGAPPPVDLGP